MNLAEIEHWFLDMDGTVYLGGDPLPGAIDLIEHFHLEGIGYTFLTNNSSRASAEYAGRLRRLGFRAQTENIFTSGQASAGYLSREHPNARVYLLGTPALAGELAAAGVAVVEDDPDTVVLGFDPNLSFARLTRACTLLRKGAAYFATHPDVNCPVAGGYLPDAGSVMALIEASTGRRPIEVVGKPNARFIEEAAARRGVDLSRCAMVGDRLETDVAMALQVGIPGVLVLTGATDANDRRLATPQWRDVQVLGGMVELKELLGVSV